VKVVVDRTVCIGAGQCMRLAPDVFGQDEDGLVVLLNSEPPPDAHARVSDAILACPSLAIREANSPPDAK
jgi:ferredoxin